MCFMVTKVLYNAVQFGIAREICSQEDACRCRRRKKVATLFGARHLRRMTIRHDYKVNKLSKRVQLLSMQRIL